MMEFTHFNSQGRAKMVDVSEKKETKRVAVARSEIKVAPLVLEKIEKQEIGKGDVFAVAQIAGVMAAKNTAQIIPMCHPLPLTGIDIIFRPQRFDTYAVITIEATVKTTGKTGVEMEALTAASVAALTIYDMCKAVEKEMEIGQTYVVRKTGGKSGDYERQLDN
ncbi:cyclic pyranopterin monophosphate synthase MoaC [Alkalihalobacillus oceani]|uniref:cyclic pyranopterin monophosphate synthase MoaC n=1 Tax=Halalkalibacter oceani TaxID=1653776 RepID=UPI00203C4424|nr:cyclic pyranopterin monophosphate synthase MoaC [Halalkalibacter oceani]MCM3760268.1 cyclic pyranopterin monophosphate synthase MoaC [Halalkalibacter oceani]